MSAREGVIPSISEDSCASLGPYLRGLVGNFCTGLNKSVDEAFRADFIGSQFHTNTAIDVITFFFKGAVSEDGDGFTEGEDVVHSPAEPVVI